MLIFFKIGTIYKIDTSKETKPLPFQRETGDQLTTAETVTGKAVVVTTPVHLTLSRGQTFLLTCILALSPKCLLMSIIYNTN